MMSHTIGELKPQEKFSGGVSFNARIGVLDHMAERTVLAPWWGLCRPNIAGHAQYRVNFWARRELYRRINISLGVM